MRAVLVVALVTAVVLHTDIALANQKRLYPDTNSQYNNLATEAYNQLEFSSYSNSTNPSQFVKYYRDHGAEKRFGRGVLNLPQGDGAGGGRGGRGRGGRGKVAHDRRGCFSFPCSPLAPLAAPRPPPPSPPTSPDLSKPVHPPQLAPRPPPAALHAPPRAFPPGPAQSPLHTLLQYLPRLSHIQQYFYSVGVSSVTRQPIPSALSVYTSYIAKNRHLLNDIAFIFFHGLGRQHAGGPPVPDSITSPYLDHLSRLYVGDDLIYKRSIIRLLVLLKRLDGSNGGNGNGILPMSDSRDSDGSVESAHSYESSESGNSEP